MTNAVEAHVGSAVTVVAAVSPSAVGVEALIGGARTFRLLLRAHDRRAEREADDAGDYS